MTLGLRDGDADYFRSGSVGLRTFKGLCAFRSLEYTSTDCIDDDDMIRLNGKSL